MQLLTPRHHLPIPAATNWALIIRPAFSTNPTCHLAIWSKELTNREMFRPKYQSCKSCSVFSVHCSPPTVASDMGACPILVSWACRTSLSMPANPSASLGMKETKGWVWTTLLASLRTMSIPSHQVPQASQGQASPTLSPTPTPPSS